MEETEAYFDFLWGEKEGIVRLARVDADADDWDIQFFRWPTDRHRLVEAVGEGISSSRHVYVGPALLSTMGNTKDAFGSSSVEWADYDHQLPESRNVPDLVVRTSPGRFHAYWKVEDIDSAAELESRNKKHGGDSCFDATHLLRVPGSVNQKNGWLVDSFQEVPTLFYCPTPIQEKASSTDPPNDRSGALFSIAVSLAEHGATREEIVTETSRIDERWKKFSGREDKNLRLAELIDRAIGKASIQVPLMSFGDIIDAEEVKVDWIIKPLLYKGAIGTIAGRPGVGKTQIAIRLATSIILEKPLFDHFDVQPNEEKILFFSYEMKTQELKTFLQAMDDLGEHKKLLSERFWIHPVGHRFSWENGKNQTRILSLIEKHNITGVIIDSYSRVTESTMKEEEGVNSILEFVDTLSARFGCWVIFIHHMRKGDAKSDSPESLEDLYGNVFLGGGIRTGIVATAADSHLRIKNIKSTLAPEFPTFYVSRTPQLDFVLASIVDDDDEVPELPKPKPKKKQGKLEI